VTFDKEMISFPKYRSAVKNHLTRKLHQLIPLSDLSISSEQIERIVSICNEPQVFMTLFSESFPDGKYPRASAKDWISWAQNGWQDGSHFVFATIDDQGLVIAACDIKSADIQNAEIGYWASSHHRGVMTNSVSAMLDMGRRAGFLGFYANVLERNESSRRVLERIGFSPVSLATGKPGLIRYKSEQCV
jgi:RimJ/RimL family protein N-acetyltransferase